MYPQIGIVLKISGGLLMTEMLWPDPSDSCKPEEVLLLSVQSAGDKSGVNGAESGLLLPTTIYGLSRKYGRKQILLPTQCCLFSVTTTFGINPDPLQNEPKIPTRVRIGSVPCQASSKSSVLQ